MAGNPAKMAGKDEAPGKYHPLQKICGVNADPASSTPWISGGWQEVDSGAQDFVQ